LQVVPQRFIISLLLLDADPFALLNLVLVPMEFSVAHTLPLAALWLPVLVLVQMAVPLHTVPKRRTINPAQQLVEALATLNFVSALTELSMAPLLLQAVLLPHVLVLAQTAQLFNLALVKPTTLPAILHVEAAVLHSSELVLLVP
jgi:hypothetical protein